MRYSKSANFKNPIRHLLLSPCGVVVSIQPCHGCDPSSNLGMGVFRIENPNFSLSFDRSSNFLLCSN